MKRTLAALVAGVILGSAGVAVAGQHIFYNQGGIVCARYNGSTAEVGVGCMLTSQRGYGVTIGKKYVTIIRLRDYKSVAFRAQP